MCDGAGALEDWRLAAVCRKTYARVLVAYKNVVWRGRTIFLLPPAASNTENLHIISVSTSHTHILIV